MKKKLIATLLALASVGCLSFGLAACNEKSPERNDGAQQYAPGLDGNGVISKASEGLEYTLSEDGKSYSVSGIGTCTDTNIVIPSTYNNLPVKAIGAYAFEYCMTFNGTITIPDSVTSIGEAAFYACALQGITIPNSVKSIEDYAFFSCSLLNHITIPDGVTSIGNGTFSGCLMLKNITIPNSVTSIGDSAFYFCSMLISITIPNSVTSIGSEAFRGCSSLTSITVGENNANYKSIDGNLYSKDGTRLIQYAKGKTATTFNIPKGVTSIGNSAFSNCESLTTITIPNSVTNIGRSAFSDCSSLTSINFGGTKAQWNSIGKLSGWNSGTGNYTVHCTDGDIEK